MPATARRSSRPASATEWSSTTAASPIAELVAELGSKFWWGTTSSSVGTEGAAPSADWARWETAKRVPPSKDGNGFATNYADDLALLADFGLAHQRITVEWARIEPAEGRIDGDALDHYRQVFATAREVGVFPWATLANTTLPGWFSDDQRGFRDERGVQYHWARHVDRVAELLDGLAVGWCPVEDPVGMALRGFLLGSRPPGRTDVIAAREAVAGALDAAFEAARLLRSGAAPVMGVFGLPTVFPARPEARDRADLWRAALWDCWIDTITEGKFAAPGRAVRNQPERIGAFDLVGVTFDHPVAVDVDDDGAEAFSAYPTDARTDATGFAPHPEELGVMLHRVAERLPATDLVLAGTGVTTTDEDWREELTRAVVAQCHQAVSDGIALRGCFFDTAIDGYEWGHGFAQARGLFDRGRVPKPAALALDLRTDGPSAS